MARGVVNCQKPRGLAFASWRDVRHAACALGRPAPDPACPEPGDDGGGHIGQRPQRREERGAPRSHGDNDAEQLDGRTADLVDHDRGPHIPVPTGDAQVGVEQRGERQGEGQYPQRLRHRVRAHRPSLGEVPGQQRLGHRLSGADHEHHEQERGHDHGDDGRAKDRRDPLRLTERAEPGDEVDQAYIGTEARHALDDQERGGRGEEGTGDREAETPGHEDRDPHRGGRRDARTDQVEGATAGDLGQLRLPALALARRASRRSWPGGRGPAIRCPDRGTGWPAALCGGARSAGIGPRFRPCLARAASHPRQLATPGDPIMSAPLRTWPVRLSGHEAAPRTRRPPPRLPCAIPGHSSKGGHRRAW